MRESVLALIAAFCVFGAGPSFGNDFEQAIEALGDYNYPKAVPALRLAANMGDHRAQEILGFMLLHGEALHGVVMPDRAEAMQWFARAAAGGSEVAQNLLRAWARRGHADAQRALASAGLRP